jgi:hypothetical protein
MSHQDWQDSLANEITNGKVVLHESDTSWFGLLSRRFPVRSSGICWEQLPSTRFQRAKYPNLSSVDNHNDIREFLKEFGSAAALVPDDMCVIVGDNTTSIAVETTYSTLPDVLLKLIDEPQSLYVVAKDGDWCLALTFEEDMYFARSLT